ncbi:transposase [Streptomyces sp. NPDC127119]|uniref:transposase n=1 Tax=Streptomyces sp. NPDC127119 TaxID=3345370 RepID=UPI00363B0524
MRGRKRLDDRIVPNGSVWTFRTAGPARRDAPERYGPWHTLHTRFQRWTLDGTFERMLRAAQADAAGDIDWLVLVGPDGGGVDRHGRRRCLSLRGSTLGSPAVPCW